MKKLIIAAMVVCSVSAVQAQEGISQNAIGLRFGHNDGFGPEISYQRLLNSGNRLELDLGFRNNKHSDQFKLTGLYQWVWNIEGGFHWYAGVGGSLGGWNHNHDGYKSSGTVLAVAGNIGIEYNFDIPIQVFIDFRPEFYLSDYYRNNFGTDFGLGVRFKF